MRTRPKTFSLIPVMAIALCLTGLSPVLAAGENVQWLNHLGFIGDADVTTAFDAGRNGLVISAALPGPASVEQGVQVAPGYLVEGIRICYEVTDADSFIDSIKLAQLQNPFSSDATPLLTDETDLFSTEPICVDSVLAGPFHPAVGPMTVTLGLSFASPPQSLVVRGIALLTVPDPDFPLYKALAEFENHTHTYLTGKGVGHNNTEATTGEAIFPVTPLPTPLPSDDPAPAVKPSKKQKKK